jgi:Holliday junction resolvasome RuvABC endonuclease subunit
MLLNLQSRPLQEDEADALAVSLTHAHILPLQQRLQRLP